MHSNFRFQNRLSLANGNHQGIRANFSTLNKAPRFDFGLFQTKSNPFNQGKTLWQSSSLFGRTFLVPNLAWNFNDSLGFATDKKKDIKKEAPAKKEEKKK